VETLIGEDKEFYTSCNN